MFSSLIAIRRLTSAVTIRKTNLIDSILNYPVLKLKEEEEEEVDVKLKNNSIISTGRQISLSQLKKNKLRNPDKAIHLYQQAFSKYTNSSTLRHAQEHIVHLLAKSNRFSDIEIFLESHKQNEEPSVSSLIRSYGSVGMFENALKKYNQLDTIKRSSLSFNALITACNRCQLFHLVPTYFNQLPAKFGFLPNAISYGILIKSYCEMGSLELAMEKLNEMETKGFEVTVKVFTSILHSLYKNGRYDEGNKFWDEMVVLKKRIKPDMVCFNARFVHIIRSGCEKTKKDFSNLFRQVYIRPGDHPLLVIRVERDGDVKPDVIFYNHVLTFWTMCGKFHQVIGMYREMLPEFYTKYKIFANTTTFTILVYHFCNHEQFEFAYEVFKDSVRKRKLSHQFGVLKCLVLGLWRMGHKKEAIDVIMDMKRSQKYLKYDIKQLDLDLASAKVVRSDKNDLTLWDPSNREWKPNRLLRETHPDLSFLKTESRFVSASEDD